MKNAIFKILLISFFFGFCGLSYAQIQTTPLDNFAIHPFGTGFNPLGKFSAIGESGATPGPTITGCDLYGFRAQLAPDRAINIGMQIITPVPSFKIPNPLPTISTSTNRGLAIIEENTLASTFSLGCGNLLVFFKQSSFGNNVMRVYGSATATGGFTTTSDRTLKRDIEPIENALEIVSKLKGYTYEYRRDERPELNLPKGQRYGFITQEVQEIMPTIVSQSTDFEGNPGDFQVMEYDAIIPVLTEAIKMQQDVITDLEGEVSNLREENSDLEARLARLEALILKDQSPQNNTSTNVNTMNTSSGIKLSQNRPNPSPGVTAIDYTLPKDMNKATLVVTDLNGRQMSSQLINAGSGTVELGTQEWVSGTYVYSVVVDGRTLASKQMIVQ